MPMLASAAVEIDGIYYNLVTKAKQAEVTSNPNYYKGEVVIPESVPYNGDVYSVTTIGENAFSGCSGLTSVTIPNTVTTIGNNAFCGCSGLTSIVIPSSVTSIGEGAFWGCRGLTSLSIPNSITSISDYTFYKCIGLTSITIPNSATSIGEGAFADCTNLMSVTSNITEPYSINSNVFSTETYRKGILYIPAGTEKLYIRFDGWREFLNIMEIGSVGNIRGDLNNDGKVDAADIVELVNIIMGK